MIKTGEKTLKADAWKGYRLQFEKPTEVLVVDRADGSVIKNTLAETALIKVDGRATDIVVKAGNTEHWSYKEFVRRETPDPVPREIPEDRLVPPSLFEQLRDFLRNEVAERYGSDSKEMETFEEADDFLVEESDMSSKYTLQPMVEENIEVPREAASPPAAEPESPPTEQPAAP